MNTGGSSRGARRAPAKLVDCRGAKPLRPGSARAAGGRRPTLGKASCRRRARHRHEAQQSDLRRYAEALRRPPIAGAPTRIDPHPSPALQAGRKRLLQTDEKVPRQELAAVRVPGKLQVEAGRFGGFGAARLMREEDWKGSRRWAASGGCLRVTGLGAIEMPGVVVGDAGNDERGLATVQDDVLVHEH